MGVPLGVEPLPAGGAAELVLMVKVVPVPLQLPLSVTVPGPPPARSALICSTTACVSMVAVLSILLRPLLPIAVINRPIRESIPKTSTKPAIESSIRVMPDSLCSFLRNIFTRIDLILPAGARPEPVLNSSCRRNADRRPARPVPRRVTEVVNKSTGRSAYSAGDRRQTRHSTRIKVHIHIDVWGDGRTPHYC